MSQNTNAASNASAGQMAIAQKGTQVFSIIVES